MRKLQSLEFEHLLPRTGGLHAEPGQDAQELERRGVRPGLAQRRSGSGGSVERGASPQFAAPEPLRLPASSPRAVEQRGTDGFHAHPGFRIGIDRGAVLLQPDRGCGGDLRRGGRSPGAVEIDDVLAAETGPRDVRRGSGDRGLHLAVRAVIPRHQAEAEIGVGLAVGHDAAGRDDAAEACGIDDVVGRQIAEIVARRGHDEDALLVERVHGVGPRLRGEAAHAHGDDVDAVAAGGIQPVHVVERLRDRAVAEQHDAVGDPNRHDLGERRSAERRSVWLARSRENAQRAGAVPEIREQSARLVGGVVRRAVVDEIAREIGPQSFRQSVMMRIVAGIEMRNAHLCSDVRSADRGDGVVELRMRGIAEPVGVRQARKVTALRVGFGAGLRQRHPEVDVAAGDPLLLQIGLGENRGLRAGDAEALLQKRMADVPIGRFGEARGRRQNLPDLADGRSQACLSVDARQQRCDRELDGGGAELQLGRGQARRGLHQKSPRYHAIARFIAPSLHRTRLTFNIL